MDWSASWIWLDDDSLQEAPNVYAYFRKELELDAVPASARAWVSADSRYVLFVNGQRVGRGPLRGDLSNYHFEEFDISRFLQPGANVIAAAVHLNTGQQAEVHSGRGGFLFQAQMGDKQVVSDQSWRCTSQTGWRRTMAQRHHYLNYVADFDANAEPWGWRALGFDAADWQPARVVAAANDGPWRLTPRPLPALREEDVVAFSVQDWTPDLVQNSVAFPAEPMVIQPSDQPVQFTVDFGREVTGFPRVQVNGPPGTVVEWRYAEHLGGVLEEPDRLTLDHGEVLFETFHWTGFRYLLFTVTGHTAPVEFLSVGCNFYSYPTENRGAFACSDPLLNQIWEVGRYSTVCCLHEHFEDCPLWEQLQYWGDARIESLVAAVCFADPRPFTHGLRQMTHSRQPDGILFSRYPCNEPQIIPTFNLIWVLSMVDYFHWVGDEKTMRDLWPNVKEILSWFGGYVGADGLVRDVPHWVFVDWAPGMHTIKQGASASVNGFYGAALKEAARLASRFGEPALAREYTERSGQIKEAFNAVFWSEENGLYWDGVDTGEEQRLGQHAQALALAYEIAPKHRVSRLVDGLMRGDLVRATPYFAFYLFRALEAAGAYYQAFPLMRQWKSMLDGGATTWWEWWDETSRSRCHAWSSSPTFELSSKVLGLQPIGPGCSEVQLSPEFGDLEWARGVVPTPMGEFQIGWRRTSIGYNLRYSAPQGVKVRVKVPNNVFVKVVGGK